MSEAEDLVVIITAVLSQAPQWIRSDLISKDSATRSRAEDALAAMIAAAIAKSDRVTVAMPSQH